MIDYYSRPPEKSVPLNLRVSRALKASVENIATLWRLMAESEGHNNRHAINVTYVCARLLSVAADEVWAQANDMVGHEGVPRTDGTWKKIEDSLRQRVRREPHFLSGVHPALDVNLPPTRPEERAADADHAFRNPQRRARHR